MEELKNALKAVGQLIEEIKAIRDEAQKRLDAVSQREKNISAREERVAKRAEKQEGYAPLEDMERSLAVRSDALSQERAELEKARSAFEQEVADTRKDLDAKKVQAQELLDQADQVRRDKIALEKEKVEYKAKIKQELMDGLK